MWLITRVAWLTGLRLQRPWIETLPCTLICKHAFVYFRCVSVIKWLYTPWWFGALLAGRHGTALVGCRWPETESVSEEEWRTLRMSLNPAWRPNTEPACGRDFREKHCRNTPASCTVLLTECSSHTRCLKYGVIFGAFDSALNIVVVFFYCYLYCFNSVVHFIFVCLYWGSILYVL